MPDWRQSSCGSESVSLIGIGLAAYPGRVGSAKAPLTGIVFRCLVLFLLTETPFVDSGRIEKRRPADRAYIVKSDGKVFIIKAENQSRSDDLAIAMEADGTAQPTTNCSANYAELQMHISNECCATTLRLGNTTSLLTS